SGTAENERGPKIPTKLKEFSSVPLLLVVCRLRVRSADDPPNELENAARVIAPAETLKTFCVAVGTYSPRPPIDEAVIVTLVAACPAVSSARPDMNPSTVLKSNWNVSALAGSHQKPTANMSAPTSAPTEYLVVMNHAPQKTTPREL